MTTKAGKLALVRVAPDDVALMVTVGGMKSFGHGSAGRAVDDTEFGDMWHTRINNLKDSTLLLEGGRRASDAGQAVLLAGLRDGTAVTVQIRPADRATFQQEMMIAKFGTEVTVDGRATFTCELEGDGPMDFNVPGTALGTEDGDVLALENDNALGTEE